MANYQSNLGSGVPLDLGPDGSGPLHERLARALREAIRTSRLPGGSLLPPSRVLAADIGCSRWVVTEAYAQLANRGLRGGEDRIGYPRPRARYHPGPARDQPRAPRPTAGRIDMAPGLPDLRAFPAARWATAARTAAATLSEADLSYPDPAGHQVLRELLAEYLTRARGAQAEHTPLAEVGVCQLPRAGISRPGSREGTTREDGYSRSQALRSEW